jgi:hypothetical protein
MKINGTEIAAVDLSVATGYIQVSGALVSAACDAWLVRRGLAPDSMRTRISRSFSASHCRNRKRWLEEHPEQEAAAQ